MRFHLIKHQVGYDPCLFICVFDRACLPYDGNLNLSREGQRLLYLFGNIPAHQDSLLVGNDFTFHDDSQFPAGQNGIGIGNTYKGIGYLLKVLQAFNVVFEQFFAGTRSCAGKPVGRLNE